MISTNTFAQKALELSKQGYTTIPLNGKRPVTENWQKLRAVTPEMVADWERQGYYRNLGMVCGSASNNVVVIDFDGIAGYELFTTAFPELADTLTVATGSGNGMHCYYKVELLPDSSGVMNIPVDGGELVNIEFKSDGKQVVIPPSTHPDTGKAYIKSVDKPIMRLSDLSAVIAWAKSLKPQETITRTESTGDLNPKLLAAVESYFLSRDHKIRREWIDCACPNSGEHRHGDSTWSFGYNTEKHFGHCLSEDGGGKDYLLRDLLPLIGIDPAAYGGLFEKRESTIQRVDGYKVAQAQPYVNSVPAQPVNTAIPVMTRTSGLTNYSARLNGLASEKPVPIPFPFPALHGFGGMARVMKPGKLIGIVGTSGGGKTSLLESMVDSWLGYHVPSLVWSPEWDGDEFVERSVQRYGGATAEELYLHEIYMSDQEKGVKNTAGVKMSDAIQKKSIEALKFLRGWEDEVGYLDCPYLTVGQLQASIEATLASIDFKPRVLVIDYVQLLLAMEENGDLNMYNLLMRIKAVCKMFNLVGCIATQVTKDSTRGMGAGKVLDAMSARFVNDDPFNLFITVTPDMNEDGTYLPHAILNVAKNSLGTKGKRRVGVQWDKLLFNSVSHSNQNFGEDDDNA